MKDTDIQQPDDGLPELLRSLAPTDTAAVTREDLDRSFTNAVRAAAEAAANPTARAELDAFITPILTELEGQPAAE